MSTANEMPGPGSSSRDRLSQRETISEIKGENPRLP
jgi:hypothetical protein